MRQHYAVLCALMNRALGVQDCEQCSDMEKRLETELQGTIEKSRYCLLNGLFAVQIIGELQVFVINNAHFIKTASWILISRVLQKIPVFMVMSLGLGYVGTEKLYKPTANIRLQRFTHLHLDELKLSAVVQKVCQTLGVVSISRDLLRFLMQRSLGNPYYCGKLLRDLRCNNLLLFWTQRQGETAKENWKSLISVFAAD